MSFYDSRETLDSSIVTHDIRKECVQYMVDHLVPLLPKRSPSGRFAIAVNAPSLVSTLFQSYRGYEYDITELLIYKARDGPEQFYDAYHRLQRLSVAQSDARSHGSVAKLDQLNLLLSLNATLRKFP